MVSTIDGKTVSGDRGDSVVDLGSRNDHQVMHRLEASADAVLLGAQTLRTTSPKWNPKSPVRIAVTRSGKIEFDSAFFSAEGTRAYVATPQGELSLPSHVGRLTFGVDELDFVALLRHLKAELGIERLLGLGGSETNAELLRRDLVDELFLTLAPKIKLGRALPTYAGGDPLDRDHLQNYALVEHHAVGSEVFLRYRRSFPPE